MGLIDDMTVIITSDHGEEFMEHGKAVRSESADLASHQGPLGRWT